MTFPSPAVFGQIAGLAAFVLGLFLMAGAAWALLTGGLVVTLWCAVAESATLAATPSARRAGPNVAGAE